MAERPTWWLRQIAKWWVFAGVGANGVLSAAWLWSDGHYIVAISAGAAHAYTMGSINEWIEKFREARP